MLLKRVHADDAALMARVHELHRVISAAERELLSCLAQLEPHEQWLDDGAHDMPHRVSMQLGISRWKAERWVSAGRALDPLPHVGSALANGEVTIDKAVELTRFVTPDDEEALVEWARDVAPGAIRRRGDELRRSERTEIEQIEDDRWLAWRWTDEGRRLLLEAELPAAQGAAVTDAIDSLANDIPTMPGEESRLLLGRRRADALAALCGSRSDGADDRTTVVVHVQAEALADAEATAVTERGAVLHVETARRLLCNADIQAVIEAADGSVLGVGRRSREPSAWMMRQPPSPRSDVHVPPVRQPAVLARAPHQMVVTRRPNRPRQPGVGLHVPPPTRARARLEPRARTRRRGQMVPAGRRSLSSRPTGGLTCGRERDMRAADRPVELPLGDRAVLHDLADDMVPGQTGHAAAGMGGR